MNRWLIVSALAFIGFAHVQADDAARATIEKGIKAAGWENDPIDIKMSWKDKGKLTVMGMTLPYDAQWNYAAPDKYNFSFTAEFGGMKLALTVVANGKNAWESGMGMTRAVTGEKLEYMQNETYHMYVIALVGLLKDKEFKLAALPDSEVDGQAVTGVEVKRQGRPDTKLYFDKKTGLLAKSATTVKDEFQNWKEVPEEAFYSDWKDAGKRKVFGKLKVVREGKPLIESEFSDQKIVDKFDAKLFEEPGK